MKLQKRRIKYEVFNYEGPTPPTFAFKAYTLVYKNPASVSFFNYGPPGFACIINNNLFLSPFLDFQAGLANTDYKYQFINAVDEIDSTVWTLKVFAGGFVQVVVKFYVDEE